HFLTLLSTADLQSSPQTRQPVVGSVSFNSDAQATTAEQPGTEQRCESNRRPFHDGFRLLGSPDTLCFLRRFLIHETRSTHVGTSSSSVGVNPSHSTRNSHGDGES